jgi:hypothetical protein
MKWVCGMHEEEEKCVMVLVGRPKLERLLGIRRWKHNTSVYLTEIGWGGGHELD